MLMLGAARVYRDRRTANRAHDRFGDVFNGQSKPLTTALGFSKLQHEQIDSFKAPREDEELDLKSKKICNSLKH